MEYDEKQGFDQNRFFNSSPDLICPPETRDNVALLQINRLKNYFTYRVVQIFKNIPDIFIFTNLILRTRSCGIGLFTVILDFSLSIFM